MAKVNVMKLKSKKTRIKLISVSASIGVILLGSLVYYLMKPISPDEVVNQTMRALESGDISRILKLTSSEELEKLNLNSYATEAILKATFWQQGYPKHLKAVRLGDSPVDVLIYEVTSSSHDKPDLHWPMRIVALDSPKKGWHLGLSFTLFYATAVANPDNDTTNVGEEFLSLANQYGVLGILDNHNQYKLFSDRGRVIEPEP